MTDLNKWMENLKAEVTKDPAVRLLRAEQWGLPVATAEVSFEVIRRNKMDLLMKMILMVCRKLPMETAEEISDVLRVETLFIQDMMSMMKHAGMMEMKNSMFTLTPTGEERLTAGQYVHPPAEEERVVHYSAFHQDFLEGEPSDFKGEIFRHAEELNVESIPEQQLRNQMQKYADEERTDRASVTVGRVLSVTELAERYVPVFEYRLKNEAEQRMYVRVFNTMTKQWDAVLEEKIMERDLAAWRKEDGE